MICVSFCESPRVSSCVDVDRGTGYLHTVASTRGAFVASFHHKELSEMGKRGLYLLPPTVLSVNGWSLSTISKDMDR